MISVYTSTTIKIIFWIVLVNFRIKGILGKMQPELHLPNLSKNTRLYPISTPSVSNCRNPNLLNQPYICQFVNRFKTISPIIGKPLTIPSQNYLTDKPTNRQARSYYGSFGHGAPAAPAYYPTFDPISVLASLAFLAFLLQSFASLFDRSRSIIPTIVSSSRHSPSDITEDVEERVMRALDEYTALENKLLDENKETTKSKSSIKR